MVSIVNKDRLSTGAVGTREEEKRAAEYTWKSKIEQHGHEGHNRSRVIRDAREAWYKRGGNKIR